MIKGVQKFNRLTAGELMARPTYAEEFQNIRENYNKVVIPNDPDSFARSQRSFNESGESRVANEIKINLGTLDTIKTNEYAKEKNSP